MPSKKKPVKGKWIPPWAKIDKDDAKKKDEDSKKKSPPKKKSTAKKKA